MTITQPKPGFYCAVKNKTDKAAELYFYGDIVNSKSYKWSSDDKCPTDVVEALEECKDAEQLDIYINSGGGSVFAGNAIFNRLKAHKAHKTVHIDGVAASIASVIALAGDEIIMPENTYMMIHKAWTYAIGNSSELKAAADRLEKLEESIVEVYDRNTGDEFTADKIRELMAAETWLSATEAAEMFTNVSITDDIPAAACISDMKYKNAPDNLIVDYNKVFSVDTADTADKNDEPDGSHESDDKNGNEVKNRLDLIENFIFTERENENEQKNA